MYVCLCNGFTDRQVRTLAATAQGSVACVYRALGVRPQCGKCVPIVKGIVREHSGGAASAGLAESGSSA
ncbi:MAG TPA: (2Fe-2S)-binding protein [Stellaceae bacterium]|jgi:bacterioferritin-associated ferredoxin|nr:(2Fe-2S)-binding protein [Stellaceae bacterium]